MIKRKPKVLMPVRDELLSLYQKEGSTLSSVGRFYGTSHKTVKVWLDRYEIPSKDHKTASVEANNRHRLKVKPTKKQLLELYSESSIKELEKYYNVSQQTIYDWFSSYEIELRSLDDSCKLSKQRKYRDIQFTKEYLEEQYDRKKPIEILSEKLGVSRSHILKLFSIHNIEKTILEPSYRSKAEIDLFEYLKENFPYDNWITNDRAIINPYELDIVNTTKKIAIEYCGLYWHSEFSSGKNKNYHSNKYQLCEDIGYKLITIFESDDIDKVRKLLLKLLGKTQKIYARNTCVKTISSTEAKSFHDKHHLHNSIGASYHYGLFHNDNLVMVGSFGKNRFSNNYQYECSRLTSGDITVVGGVSKLFKHFIKEVQPESIVTFSDLRFGNGKSYLSCGFKEVEKTPPNYWYHKKNTCKLFSRVKFQKHKLETVLEHYDPDKTEFENMIDNKWDRIWDCGNAKYEWKKEKGGT